MDKKLYEALVAKIDNLTNKVQEMDRRIYEMDKRINKRLDGIEYELKKIDTVLGYTAQYENIPS